jgi:two-component system nitrate/nitrite response regulator NarL
VATRVLIVDNDPSFRRVAAKLLHARGFIVVGEAHDACQAGDRVRELRPDGVLLDLHLGDTDGFTVVRILRRARAGLSVLLTSSDAAAASSRLAQECGATGFVPKTELVTTDLTQYLTPAGEVSRPEETSAPRGPGGGPRAPGEG